MNTIGTKDIKLIHEKVFSERQHKFYAHILSTVIFRSCLFFLDPEFDGEITFKFRPSGGFIGFDNSRLDHLLKRSKVLRLLAALRDAAGFKRLQKQRPWICLRFPLLTSKQLSFWPLDRNIVHSQLKFFILIWFVNWNARKCWQQNHKYNCPRSRRFQTQVTCIHYKRTQFVFQLQRYNIFQTPT